VSVSVVHSIYGAQLTPFVFEHAGGASSRLSTVAIVWAVGSTLFAGSMPSLSEGLVALTGSVVAPGCYLGAVACVAIASTLAGGQLVADAEPPEKARAGDATFVELMDEMPPAREVHAGADTPAHAPVQRRVEILTSTGGALGSRHRSSGGRPAAGEMGAARGACSRI
jgi:hypothetical protein